MLCYSIH